MKIQDLGFLFIFLFLVWKKNSRITTLAGFLCLFLAMPLFISWFFFTAQRLVIYAAAFFLLSVILQIVEMRRVLGKDSPLSKKGGKQ